MMFHERFGKRLARRRFLRSSLEFAVGAVSIGSSSGILAAASVEGKRTISIGHHFWNWDRAWDRPEWLDHRLRLTKECGYTGLRL